MNGVYNAIGAYVIAEPIREHSYSGEVSRAILLSFDATPHDDASSLASEALRMLAAVESDSADADVDTVIIYLHERAITLSECRVSIPADAIVAVEQVARPGEPASVGTEETVSQAVSFDNADERAQALRDAEAMLRRVAERYEGGPMLEAADRVGAMAATAEAETNRS
jgi:hypothetical protein